MESCSLTEHISPSSCKEFRVQRTERLSVVVRVSHTRTELQCDESRAWPFKKADSEAPHGWHSNLLVKTVPSSSAGVPKWFVVVRTFSAKTSDANTVSLALPRFLIHFSNRFGEVVKP